MSIKDFSDSELIEWENKLFEIVLWTDSLGEEVFAKSDMTSGFQKQNPSGPQPEDWRTIGNLKCMIHFMQGKIKLDPATWTWYLFHRGVIVKLDAKNELEAVRAAYRWLIEGDSLP
jgi:hypothetical protein